MNRIITTWCKQKIFMTLAFLFGLAISGCTTGPTDKRIKKMDPGEAIRLASSIEALVNPQMAEGLKLQLWGVDSLVADPISIDIDDNGRLFYTRTNRQKNSEFDIRNHEEWEIESIQVQTIEEKRAFLHKVLSPERSSENEWLADLNNDGSHDWRDMTIQKEHIYRLEDSTGDGVADMAQLVVEDFHDEVTDVAGAVMAYGDELFVGVAPDLWRMKDTNGDGIADQKTSISHGYGVHVGFGGHGMSGLEMGPDGRIYWGIGDIGFNGEGSGETKWRHPNMGVIVRANPDGSDFEVFATGLRNTHEFVFDEYGNLISVDNDGDHAGESERLVYLVDGSDSGWRINWQFGKYKDPDNNSYKVWMDEEMFKPRFEGQAAYIIPPIANYVNGPTGMLYNPGTALDATWKNTFFVAEFVGNPARSGIHAFQLKPKGAGFELGKSEMILKGILATGMDFGPDGALYVADWIEGWDTKDHGRIWKVDVENKHSEERLLTRQLLAEDFSAREADELGKLLYNSDMRVRQKAQFELAKRGSAGLNEFQKSINQKEHQLARVHGIWGFSQLAREDEQDARLLLPLLDDADPEIRAQAAKWLGDIRYRAAGDALVRLLDDEYSRARFFAAEALGRIGYEPAVEQIIRLLETNNDEDAYLRHAASLALARIGKVEPVVALEQHASPAVRMGAVIALRRLSHPAIARFLDDENEYVVTEAARAINDDFSIEEALPALGNLLLTTVFSNEPLLRRAINANLRVGTSAAMDNLIGYALKTDAPENMRREAIQALGTWDSPSVLDRVDGRYRGVIERDPVELRAKATDPLISLLDNQSKAIRISAVQAMGKLRIDQASRQLLMMLEHDDESDVRIAALKVLVSMGIKNEAVELALSDPEKSVRVAGLDLMNQLDIPNELMASLLSTIIQNGTAGEKQSALPALGRLPVENTREIFEGLLQKMGNGELPPEVHLELAEAIHSTGSVTLKKTYEKIKSDRAAISKLAAYESALYGGDAALGRTIFFQHTKAQCMRCHSYDDFGGNAGPRINGVAGRLTRLEILEALIDPGKKLSQGYGMVAVDLENGKTIRGIIQGEDEISVRLKIGNKPDTLIRKADIKQRKNAPSSMPDMSLLLTEREIRDLVSFLATQKEDKMQEPSEERVVHNH